MDSVSSLSRVQNDVKIKIGHFNIKRVIWQEMSKSKNVSLISSSIRAFITTGVQKVQWWYKIKCFDNMEIFFTKSSKSKGKVSNDQKPFQGFLMTSIVHTQSTEIVSTLSYVTQNKVSLANK